VDFHSNGIERLGFYSEGFYSLVITVLTSSCVYRKLIFTYERPNDEKLPLLMKNVILKKCHFNTSNACRLCFEENKVNK
jgi:hypothetical protein